MSGEKRTWGPPPSPTFLPAPSPPWKLGVSTVVVRPAHLQAGARARALAEGGLAGGGVRGVQSAQGPVPTGEGRARPGENPPLSLALTFTNSVQSLPLDFVLIHKGHSLSHFATL